MVWISSPSERTRRGKMNPWVKDVLQFHEKFGSEISDEPSIPIDPVSLFRRELMREEMNELLDAMWKKDVEGVAKELVDVLYTVIGTAIVYGVPLDPVWDAVHKSNMDKVRVKGRYKVQKKRGYRKPNIGDVMAGKVAVERGNLGQMTKFVEETAKLQCQSPLPEGVDEAWLAPCDCPPCWAKRMV